MKCFLCQPMLRIPPQVESARLGESFLERTPNQEKNFWECLFDAGALSDAYLDLDFTPPEAGTVRTKREFCVYMAYTHVFICEDRLTGCRQNEARLRSGSSPLPVGGSGTGQPCVPDSPRW